MIFLLIVVYAAFIGLGLPDTVLGAAWPVMQADFSAPLSAAGLLSIIVSAGTIVSSLIAPSLLRFLGTGRIVFYSILLTALASVGYGFSSTFMMIAFFALPMGIGAGAIDVALNNFAAVHLASKHTNWLHASWGVGACLGPAIFSVSSLMGCGWRGAYECIALILGVLSLLMFFSLPIWKKIEKFSFSKNVDSVETISLRSALRIPGMKLSFLTFFFYSSLEISTTLWCGTYLVARGFEPEKGALVVSLMFACIMVGRVLSGFFAIKFTDLRLVHAGIAIVILGCFAMVLPLPLWFTPICIFFLGLGCAPVYPSLIHATPARFGNELSGRAIGIQMAGSYVGSILMPPAFGFVAAHFSVILLPVALAIFVGCLLVSLYLLDYVTRKKLNDAFAAERIMDVLQQVSLMEEKRKKFRRERRRLRRVKKAMQLRKGRL